ncbi:MAG: hypothetical protein OXB99_15490 [Acidimicrobiaceae bacterium]|nr:hypothetical protein [Acidimicrobiaceae bacterium]
MPAQSERLLRSAADVAPFAAADYFMSDAVRRLRVPLNAHDRPGPLHWFYESPTLSSSVYDMCDDAQAYEAHTGEAYQQGDLFPGNSYPELVSDRDEMGCDDPSFGAERPRWALRVNDWGGLRRFQTREGAVEHQQLLLAGHRERNKNTIEGDTHGLSPHGNTRSFLIRFADAGSPVDEVRLLDGSVQVVDGVLRGLVRNWSRRYWAYEVTVNAGDREFLWPLSVQPGELAPFEIEGWSGTVDPERIEIAVNAIMTDEADLSRIFRFYQEWCRWESVEDLTRPYPEHILDGLRRQGIGNLCATLIDFHSPLSHPSFPDNDRSLTNLVRIDDLRAYLGRFTAPRADSEDFDIDGSASPVLIDLLPLPLLADLRDGRYGEVDRWPIWRIDEDWLYASDPLLEAVYATGTGRFTIWIGTTHDAGNGE